MILSDNLHNYMLKVGKTKSFLMAFYVIYLVARMGILLRLNAVGTFGKAPRKNKEWEHYDQLTLQTYELHY